MTPVAGVITLDPTVRLFGPERLQPTGIRTVSGASWNWYTLLSPENRWFFNSQARLAPTVDGGCTLVSTDGTWIGLDRWGNPVGGPNAGRDLRNSRFIFLSGLYRLEKNCTLAARSDVVAELTAELRRTTATLLQEPAYRISLALVEARAWAHTGSLQEGIAVLENTLREHRNEDLVFRLGHLLALSGALHRAVQILEPMVSTPFSPRSDFDCRLLLHRVAIELGDTELADRCILGLTMNRTRDPELGAHAALRARAHLWWDLITETDCRVRSWSHEPAGGALACLARWRRGWTLPGDPEAMRNEARTNPDAPFEFPIAEAAAMLGLDRIDDAIVRLETLDPALRAASRDDFGNHQLLDLSRALHAVALARSGNVTKARAEAASLLNALTPGLLPASLAREVLEGRWTE